MGEFKVKESEDRLGLLVPKEKVLVIDGSRLGLVRRLLAKDLGLEKIKIDIRGLESMDHLSRIFGLRPSDKEVIDTSYAHLGEKFDLTFEGKGRNLATSLSRKGLDPSELDYEDINRFSELYISQENLKLISKEWEKEKDKNPRFFSLRGFLIKSFLEQKFKHQENYAKMIDVVIKVDKITLDGLDPEKRVEITIITPSQELMNQIKKALDEEDKKLKSKPRKILRRLDKF